MSPCCRPGQNTMEDSSEESRLVTQENPSRPFDSTADALLIHRIDARRWRDQQDGRTTHAAVARILAFVKTSNRRSDLLRPRQSLVSKPNWFEKENHVAKVKLMSLAPTFIIILSHLEQSIWIVTQRRWPWNSFYLD